MKKRCFKNIAALIMIAFLSLLSCKKIIHVDLNTVDSILVIDADMSSLYGLNVVLSRSVAFYDDNSFPPVNDAIVILENLKTNKIDTVPFDSNGKYYLNKKPSVGTSYQLSVIVDGVTYTAVSTMPTIIALDSVTFAKRALLGNTIISARVNFQDKAGVDNYYLFKQYILKRDALNFFAFSDRLSDGRYIQYDLLNDSSYIKDGDSIAVDMQCIDENVYNYYSVLESITAEESVLGTTSPANPPTNIVGDNVLGVFNVHSEEIKKVAAP
ncbi:MAG: DUF4249 domain-containing protein [Chitinophagaceae bacterium]